MNVVFDLGGVVVTWQPEAIIAKVFDDPRVQKNVRAQFVEHPDWLALDRGTLSPQNAIARAAKRTGLPKPDIARFLHRVPLELAAISDTVNLLYQLRANGHALFCLSNMHLACIKHLEATHSFWEVFSGRVISSRVQLLKPEPAIYTFLLDSYSLNPAETIFVDDIDANLTAACQFGLKTIKFESPDQCENRLQSLGCL